MSQRYDPMNETEEPRDKKRAGSGRGFFAVLIVCLIAVGGVAVTQFSQTDAPLSSDADEITTTAMTTVTTTAKAAAVAPATTTVTATAQTTTTTAATLYRLPLTNKVLTPYSEQPLYNETLDTYRAHTAVDFDGEEGQGVYPFAAGTVTVVEDDALWGGCVTVDHGAGVISVYCGISPSVEAGDEVTAEDRLGTLAAVPCESHLGPHLHFQLYKDGKTADAAVLFDDLTME